MSYTRPINGIKFYFNDENEVVDFDIITTGNEFNRVSFIIRTNYWPLSQKASNKLNILKKKEDYKEFATKIENLSIKSVYITNYESAIHSISLIFQENGVEDIVKNCQIKHSLFRIF